jgi:alpha-beta hydrolase superfamily lysophospholipase
VLADGVARGTFEVRANGTDLIPVTVIFPSDADGRPLRRGLPAVLYVSGGAVSPARYEWQAVELARRGVVTVLPRHPLDLGFFAIDHGLWTRDAVLPGEAGSYLDGLVDPARFAAAGHSLGGVVAMKLALSGKFQAAVVQASFADPADDAKTKALTLPTMFLAAKGDCQATEAQVREGWAKLSSPTALVVLEGMTHFQFTNSQAEDLARSCPPVLTIDQAHERVVAAMIGFLDGAFGAPATTGEAALKLIPGAQVEVR